MQMEKVNILLSTYNGEIYLPKLLDSLENQDFNNFEVIVRDDGSTDKTIEILEQYKTRLNINIIRGDHVGVTKSFLTLLFTYSGEADYYAFCDQDDIWLPNKISTAVNTLKETKVKPAMYFSNLSIFFGDSYNFTKNLKPFKKPFSLGNALIENVASGCTIIINRKARDVLIREMPKWALIHDHWIYLVLSSIDGIIIYDKEPKILYRQHSTNTIGIKSGSLINRIKRFFIGNRSYLLKKQAKEVLNIYEDIIPNKNKYLIKEYIESAGNKKLINRIKFALSGKLYKQRFLDNLMFKMALIFKII